MRLAPGQMREPPPPPELAGMWHFVQEGAAANTVARGGSKPAQGGE